MNIKEKIEQQIAALQRELAIINSNKPLNSIKRDLDWNELNDISQELFNDSDVIQVLNEEGCPIDRPDLAFRAIYIDRELKDIELGEANGGGSYLVIYDEN